MMVLGPKHVGAVCVLMCKFYISALVGIIIELLDNMYGVTMETIIIIIKYLKLLQHVSDHKGSIIRELYTVLG